MQYQKGNFGISAIWNKIRISDCIIKILYIVKQLKLMGTNLKWHGKGKIFVCSLRVITFEHKLHWFILCSAVFFYVHLQLKPTSVGIILLLACCIRVS